MAPAAKKEKPIINAIFKRVRVDILASGRI
jgi:hypothetical protein